MRCTGIGDLGAQDVPFTLTFDNTGTDSGYVPYVDLMLPAGADMDDGVTFDSASFLGTPLETGLRFSMGRARSCIRSRWTALETRSS